MGGWNDTDASRGISNSISVYQMLLLPLWKQEEKKWLKAGSLIKNIKTILRLK